MGALLGGLLQALFSIHTSGKDQKVRGTRPGIQSALLLLAMGKSFPARPLPPPLLMSVWDWMGALPGSTERLCEVVLHKGCGVRPRLVSL